MSKRIQKLTSVKDRAVTAAERALVQARAATAAAEQSVRASEAAWLASIDRAAAAETADDLAVHDARGRTLRMAVQRAQAVVGQKQREEQRFLAEVAAARTELRRFELWGEKATAAVNAAANQKTRAAEDALAARSTTKVES
ncbi:MAG: hypothetical protein JWP97_6630 [Labilithrix sp.]|nr:hypothetical protein [Labilithrix sp.]